MFEFVERIRNEKGIENPLEKIDFLISKRGEKPFCFLPYDVLEKICGNVLFDYLDFKEGENLLPEKRLDLFLEKTKSLTIEKDFMRLCQENRVFEISLLLDRDDTDEIYVKEIYTHSNVNLSTLACCYGRLDIVKLLQQKNRKFETDAMDCAAGNGRLEVLIWLKENFPDFGCSPITVDFVAYLGYIKILIWLKENYPEISCTTNAISWASQEGRLDILVWLKENFPEICCTTDAIYTATKNGHHEVVSFLRSSYPNL